MRRIAIILTLVCGCQDETKSPAEPPPEQADSVEELQLEGEFFAGNLAEESTLLGDDFSVVTCVGASPEEQADLEHPQLIRGQVVAPHGQIAVWTPLDLLVSLAHAVPVEGEQTVGGVPVELVALNSKGESGQIFATAKADALGRYCFKLPQGAAFGPELGLRVKGTQLEMRALALSRAHGNVSVMTDVLLTLYLEKGELAPKARNHLINLHTLADSAVDLLAPVTIADGNGVTASRTEVRARLLADARFSKALGR